MVFIADIFQKRFCSENFMAEKSIKVNSRFVGPMAPPTQYPLLAKLE